MRGKMKKTYLLLAMATIFSTMLLFTNSASSTTTKCTFSIAPSSNTLPSGGGSGGVDITTQSGCKWTALSKVNWITLSPGSGTGNGSIVYVVSVNNGAKRTGTMTIAGKTFTLTQTGSTVSPIVFDLPPTLAEACLNETYSYQVPEPSGGLGAPYHFQLDTGGFPPMGIAVGLDGTISGTPVSPGRKTFRVCAVDVGGYSICMKTSIVVSKTPCCSSRDDECQEISMGGPGGLSPCSVAYSCITALGHGYALRHGYYKAGIQALVDYFCCEGTETEIDCEQATDNVAQYCDVPPDDIFPVCSFTYSDWSVCQSDGTQTRTVISSSPADCVGGFPVLSQRCTYVPPTCTSFTYSAWSPTTCPPNGKQTRTVTSSSPPGCVGGSPVLKQSCNYVPPSHVCSGTASCNAYGTAQCTVEYPCDQGTCTYTASAGAPSQFSLNIDANGNVTGGIYGTLDVNGNFTWTWTGEGFLVSGHGTVTCSGNSLFGTGSWTVGGSIATVSCSGGGTFSCNGTASN